MAVGSLLELRDKWTHILDTTPDETQAARYKRRVIIQFVSDIDTILMLNEVNNSCQS